MDLTETELPAYIVRRLEHHGYPTVEAVAMTPDAELSVHRNMGRTTMDRIRAVIPYQADGMTNLARLRVENAALRGALVEIGRLAMHTGLFDKVTMNRTLCAIDVLVRNTLAAAPGATGE